MAVLLPISLPAKQRSSLLSLPLTSHGVVLFRESVSVPFRKEEFAVISRYFKSRYHDSAPSAEAPRYQTAGSIGALARDEPVTPGVTFLSHPAPNSED